VDNKALDLVHSLIDRHVAAGRGDRPALAAGDELVTYRDLQARVDRRARALELAGVSAGDRIALRLPNAILLAEVWLALQRIGATAITLPVVARPREMAHILHDADVRVCVTIGAMHAEVDDACARLDRPPHVRMADERDIAVLPATSRDTARDVPAIIAYASDVSGDAHGCCHQGPAMLAAADAYGGAVIGLNEVDVAGGAVPLAFTYGLGALLVMPLQAGACAVLEERFDANRLLDSIQGRGVTVLFGTATSYRLLLKIPDLEHRGNHRSLRLCVSAGEPLEAAVASEWRERTGIELIDSLGSTEMFHVYVSQRPGGAMPGTIGTAVPGYETRVESAPGLEAPAGGTGRLLVRGPTCCTYWRRPDLQRSAVREGWHITGDLVRRDADGAIRFVRRADDLIVSAGYNVSAAEIERVLAAHPDVLGARVTGVPDPVRGQVVRASVVLAPHAERQGAIARLQESAGRELAPYKWPRKWQIEE
jgi:2-aminobenzoate-CoA ligase